MRFSFLLPLAFAGACLAQGGRPAAPPQGGRATLQEFLGLTDQQMTQFRQIRRQQAEAQRPVREQINAKQRQLNELLGAPGADPAAVGQLMIDIADLRRSLPQGGQDMRDQALAVLTPDQKAKLSRLQEAQNLMPLVNQAAAMGLLERPEPPAGAGSGARQGLGAPGPAGRGPGPRAGRRLGFDEL